MTDPVQAEEFVCATKVDALAVAVGNVHGFYRGEPKLDVARLAEIRRRVSIPLVLHGASGLPDAQITQAIAHGICKFNVNTEIRVAFFDSLAKAFAQARQTYDLPTLLNPTIEAMQQVVEAKIELFGCAGKAL
jgi:tagatose 1,6-diphosphate aldolase GatY/KbaY